MAGIVGALCGACLYLLAAVLAPIVNDRPWEHQGATGGWSPMRDFPPPSDTIGFTPAATGWPE